MFLRASCGCIVMPPHKASETPGMVECVLIQPCDSDGDSSILWCFHTRKFESWKVIHVPSRDYKSNPVPSPLTLVETTKVIDAIGRLVVIGKATLELNSQLRWIDKLATDMPQGIS